MVKVLYSEDVIHYYDELLRKHGYTDEADEMMSAAESGEKPIAVGTGVFYAHLRHLTVPERYLLATLSIVEAWEDEEAIEACKALLEKEPATV